MKDTQFRLEIDGKLENLSTIAIFIGTAMRQLGLEKDMFKVQMAVDEACTNIIQHAYSGKGGSITISCELRRNDFVITITYGGKPFDPSSVPPPDLDGDLDERKIGGLGIYLMRKLMDDIGYELDSQKGNKLIMRKSWTD